MSSVSRFISGHGVLLGSKNFSKSGRSLATPSLVSHSQKRVSLSGEFASSSPSTECKGLIVLPLTNEFRGLISTFVGRVQRVNTSTGRGRVDVRGAGRVRLYSGDDAHPLPALQGDVGYPRLPRWTQ